VKDGGGSPTAERKAAWREGDGDDRHRSERRREREREREGRSGRDISERERDWAADANVRNENLKLPLFGFPAA
jgi:hypothetical protein